MELLREYYRNRLKLAVTAIVGLAILFREVVEPAIPQGFQSVVMWAGSAFVGVLFLTAEWFIRTYLWKFERRNLDFSGLWEGTATYTSIEKPLSGAKGAAALPAPTHHSARIVQSCLGIRIHTTGEPFVWYSVAMDITSKGRLRYAYEISYRNEGFPTAEPVIGYETTTAVEYGRSFLGRQRPVKLMGTFAHCAQGQAPVYRGTIVFDLVDEKAKRGSKAAGRSKSRGGRRVTKKANGKQ